MNINEPSSQTNHHEYDPGKDSLDQDRERIQKILADVKDTEDLQKLENAVRQIQSIVTDVQNFLDYITDIKILVRKIRTLSNQQSKMKQDPTQEQTEFSPKQSESAPPDEPPLKESKGKIDTDQPTRSQQELLAQDVLKDEGIQRLLDNTLSEYQRIGIDRNSPSIKDELKIAYRRLQKKLHTDYYNFLNDRFATDHQKKLFAQLEARTKELNAINDRITEAFNDEQTKKQEKKTDPNEIHIIITLTRELTRLRTDSPSPLKGALDKINSLHQQIKDPPIWFRLLRSRVFRIQGLIQTDPFAYNQSLENYSGLGVNSELESLFNQVTTISCENEKKSWGNYEEDFLKGNAFESLSNLSFLRISLENVKRSKRFPDALVEKWQRALQTMQDLLNDESILDVPLNNLPDKLQGLFASKDTWTRASDFIAREVVKRKKERVKPQLLEKLRAADSFESSIDVLFSYTGFIQEAAAMKELLNYQTAEGKKKIGQEKRNPTSILFLEKSQEFWRKVEDIDLKQALRPLFETWAKRQQEQWWDEIEQNKEVLKTELQQRISQVIPLYVEGIIADSESLGQIFTSEQNVQLQQNITQRMIETATQLVGRLDLSQQTGVRTTFDLEFIRSDERFSTSQTDQMRRRDILFTFQDREKVGWSEHHRESLPSEKKLSEIVWKLCDQISQELTLERGRLLGTTTFLLEGKARSNRALRPKTNGTLFVEKMFSSMNDSVDDYADHIIPILVARLLQESSMTSELKKKRDLQENYNLRFNSYFFSKDKLDERKWQEAIPQAIEYVTTSLGIPLEVVTRVSQELLLSPSQESLVRLVDSVLRNESGEVEFVDEDSLTLPKDTPGKDLQEIRNANLKAALSSPRGDEFKDNLLDRNVIPKKWMDADAQSRETNIRKFIDGGFVGWNILGFNGTLYGAKETKMTERFKKLVEAGDINYSGSGIDINVKISDILSAEDVEEIVTLAKNSFDRDDALKVIRFKLDTSARVKELITSINTFVEQEMQKALENPERYLQQFGGISMENNLQAVDWFNIFFNVVKRKFDETGREDHANLIFSSNRALQNSSFLPVLNYGMNLKKV